MQPSHLLSADEWFIRGERDLIHAEQSLTNAIVINEAIVYHTQQAAEKALKGYLTACGRTFPKIHDVAQLITTAATSCSMMLASSRAWASSRLGSSRRTRASSCWVSVALMRQS
jgi:HEPN domain-containing protein